MAKIDTTLIAGYEDMTAEEKLSALEAFEYNDYSTEVDKLKKAVSKANSEAAEYKKKHKELLSEESQKKIENEEYLENIQKELATLKLEKAQNEFKARYMANGYSEELASKAAVALTENDYDTMFKIQSEYLSSRDKDIKANLLKNSPKPPNPSPDNNGTMTKADFMKLSPTERFKFSQTHPDEYKAFYN